MTALAMHGGPKAVTAEHGPHIPTIGPREREAVITLLDQGVISIGNRTGVVEELEEALKSYFGCDYALTLCSGTAALHAGLFAAGVCPGDEVLVPSFTWVATAAAILQCGAVPVFCDIDPRTHCIDPNDMAKRITPRTKAALPVHLWGHPAEMDAIRALAAAHGFRVVEDASHAHGSTYKEHKIGLLGDVGCFSMQGSKALAGGEAGFLTTNDRELYERAMHLGMSSFRLLGELALEPYARYAQTGIGWKYRIHPLAAGLALAQLESLDERNAHRIERLNQLTAALEEVPGITPPYTAPYTTRGGYYGYVVVIDEDKLGVSRDTFIEALVAEGVEASPMRYAMLHQGPLYRDLPLIDGVPALHLLGQKPPERVTHLELPTLPVTESLHPRMINLGIAGHASIGEDLVQQYAEAFEKVAAHVGQLRKTRAAI